MKVAIARACGGYPELVPFDPDTRYPEYRGQATSSLPNAAYAAVRSALIQLGLDAERLGTAAWNPLGHLISPGQTVFIKPNLVDHKHRFGETPWSVITHPSVTRAVLDYVAIALGGRGRILIGDNPHVDCDWDALEKLCSLTQVCAYAAREYGISCEAIDLRQWHTPDLRTYGFKMGRRERRGDPQGNSIADLGKNSLFNGVPAVLMRGTYNERWETISNHIRGHHRYSFSNSILLADTFISVPKLKSHAKVGATLNIKGLIGTVANKNMLVHWRLGFPRFGGDEYPPPEKRRDYLKLYWQHLLSDVVPSPVYFAARNWLNRTRLGSFYNRHIACDSQRIRMLRGAWDQNDTTWRMTVDVYNAFVKDLAALRSQRGNRPRFFSVVDGIVGGDSDGPHFPAPTEPRLVLAGEDLLAVDLTAARLMDFDLEAIRYLAYLRRQEDVSLGAIQICSDVYSASDFFQREQRYLQYRPPQRWPRLSLHGLEPGPSYLPLKA